MKKIISVLLIISLVLGGETCSFTSEATKEVKAATNSYGLRDNIQEGVILHCFNWKYNDIKAELPNIAKAGFTSVQTSPAQKGVKSGTWYWLYQPLGFYIGDNDIGTKAELKALCEEADKYGIKVIVDIVANHLAGDHTNIQDDLKDSQYWHNYSNTIDYYNRYEITHGNLGMADLNTEHEYVMQCVSNYIAELKSVGVDGLRWDAAKHIGLPSEGSNFWSTVCNNNGMWNYGEILGGPTSHDTGYEYLMTEYTNYMSVTDSSYGSTLRKAFNNGTVPTTHANWTAKAVATDKMVYWAETHDTWSNGPETGYSYEMSQNVIDRAYAIAASREGSSALYFSRPSETEKNNIKAGVKGSTHFKSKEVAAINHFHNEMVGQSEYFVSSGNVAAVCREKGVVVALGTGSGYVSFPNGGGTTEPGTYIDEITGNTWTVTETTISGTVGDTGIAVVYDYENVEEEAVNTAYLSLPSGWSEPVYCYVYNDEGASNATWPGVQMIKESSTGFFKYDVPDEISNPKVIFYSSDSNRYPNDMEPGLSFDTYGKWIYIDGVWKEYIPGEIVTSVTETTTEAIENSNLEGYVSAQAGWNELPYWSVYFAPDWGNSPTGQYKEATSYSDFGVYINSESLAPWAIQIKTHPIEVVAGKEYVCTITADFNMDMTNTVIFKDENTQTENTYTLKNGKNTFEITFVANSDTAQMFFDLGMLPKGANLEITSYSLVCNEEETTVEETTSSEIVTEEETTMEETTVEESTVEETTTVTTIEGGIEINGCQISATNKGMRTIYSVDSSINGKEVVASGMIYSLADYATEADMYVGSNHNYVRNYTSTINGILPNIHTESQIATSYAMTMRFATCEALEYTANWRVRAYAELSDGTYVYTDCVEYTIYELADTLYQGGLMSNETWHKYLYEAILSVVNKDYVVKEYDMSNMLV